MLPPEVTAMSTSMLLPRTVMVSTACAAEVLCCRTWSILSLDTMLRSSATLTAETMCNTKLPLTAKGKEATLAMEMMNTDSQLREAQEGVGDNPYSHPAPEE